MATGNPSLRNLDHNRECRQRNCQKPGSMWIAETKCHPGRDKDQKMLKIVWGAGCWPDRRGAEGQSDDGPGEQKCRSLKNPLHMTDTVVRSEKTRARPNSKEARRCYWGFLVEGTVIAGAEGAGGVAVGDGAAAVLPL
jgi:hypothetical protein